METVVLVCTTGLHSLKYIDGELTFKPYSKSNHSSSFNTTLLRLEKESNREWVQYRKAGLVKCFCEGKLECLAIWTFLDLLSVLTALWQLWAHGQTKGTSWPDHTLLLRSRTAPGNHRDPTLEIRFYTSGFCSTGSCWGVLTLVADGRRQRRKADTFFRHFLTSGSQADWEGN